MHVNKENRPRKVWIREYKGKRGKSYRVSFFDTTAKARRTLRSFKTKHLAVAYKNDYENFLNGTGPNPNTHREDHVVQPNARPWNETTEQWIESGATRKKTQVSYRSMLKRFSLAAHIATVEEVSEETIASFLTKVKRSGRSLATCAGYLRALAAFFSWARPTDSPVTKSLNSRWSPYKTRKCARPHYYTKEEYEALMRACESIKVSKTEQRDSLWWKTFISVSYYAGSRLNETAHLIWRDIDFNNGILRIQPHAKLKGIFDWKPKGKARRNIPIPSSVLDLIEKMQTQQQEGVPYVFLPPTRYQELVRIGGPKSEILHGMAKGFKKLRYIAEILEGTIHDMRRTCITNWAKSGLFPKEVQVLAGHEDLNTTLEIYAMVDEEDVVMKAKNIIEKQQQPF